MSFLRSTMKSQPSSSMKPTSPVRSSPPGSASSVAFWLLRYCWATMGPAIATSPTSRGPSGFPASSRIRTIASRCGSPVDRLPDSGSTGARMPWGTVTACAAVSVSPYPCPT